MILWIDDVSELDGNCRGICAVGSSKRKKFIEQAQSKGLKFTTFAHPSAFISSSSTLGTGTIVGAGSIISEIMSLYPQVPMLRGKQ